DGAVSLWPQQCCHRSLFLFRRRVGRSDGLSRLRRRLFAFWRRALGAYRFTLRECLRDLSRALRVRRVAAIRTAWRNAASGRQGCVGFCRRAAVKLERGYRSRTICLARAAVSRRESAQGTAERLTVYSWRIESKFQAAALASFSPIRSVLSLTKRYGGTGRLHGPGTPQNTPPSGAYLEPWHGQK